MEMIIVLLFFSISGAVCIQLFAKAHLISEASVNLNQATMYAESIAELFQGYSGDTVMMSKDSALDSLVITDKENTDKKTLILLFDKDWNILKSPANPETQSKAVFLLMAEIEELPAAVVYADTQYALNISLDQSAAVCNIEVLDIQTQDLTKMSPDKIEGTPIYSLKTDIYLGRK